MRTLGLLSVTLLGALTALSVGCGTSQKATPVTDTGGKAAASGSSSGGASNMGGGASTTGGTSNAGGSNTGGGSTSTGGKATGGTSTNTGGTSTNTGGTSSTTGGTSATTGGTSSTTGGTSTSTGGATSNNLCEVVSSLPNMGSACGTVGQSQCLSNGDRCVCERGIWYCNNSCPGSQPTPNTACTRGQACVYNNGNAGCACINLLWMCVGVSSCPGTMPTTGNACNNLTGVACDYPNSNPALHFACMCTANADAGSGSTWTCVQSAQCPTTQPSYSLTDTCSGTAICTYSNSPNHCACMQAGTPWVCL